MTHSDSMTLSLTCASDTATIKTAEKTIVIEPTAIFVDGVVVANIDNGVADVQVRVKRGAVTFVADGMPVETSVR